MGVKQWLFQRASNFVFVLFGIWLFVAFFSGSLAQQETLSGLLSGGLSRVLLGLVLLLAALNSILAGWQIAGDYAHKINVSQSIIVAVAAIISLGYLAFGLSLLA